MAFSAALSAVQGVTTGAFTLIIFDQVEYDFGNNYNRATGLFTAPAVGAWHFDAWSVPSVSPGVGNSLWMAVYVNGVAKRYGQLLYVAAAGQVPGVGIGVDLLLQAGDTVGIYIQNGGAAPGAAANSETWFTGHQVT